MRINGRTGIVGLGIMLAAAASLAAGTDPVAVHRAEAAVGGKPEPARLQAGEKAYQSACLACHQADGKGLPGAFPPLAGSDYLKADKHRAIKNVMQGLTGPVVVNGVTFNSVMPPMSQLSDAEIADALTYAMNSWGNAFGVVSATEVAAVRAGPKPSSCHVAAGVRARHEDLLRALRGLPRRAAQGSDRQAADAGHNPGQGH
jgi:mono/diheme cytochrome c family protein